MCKSKECSLVSEKIRRSHRRIQREANLNTPTPKIKLIIDSYKRNFPGTFIMIYSKSLNFSKELVTTIFKENKSIIQYVKNLKMTFFALHSDDMLLFLEAVLTLSGLGFDFYNKKLIRLYQVPCVQNMSTISKLFVSIKRVNDLINEYS